MPLAMVSATCFIPTLVGARVGRTSLPAIAPRQLPFSSFTTQRAGTGEFYSTNNNEISLLHSYTNLRTTWTHILQVNPVVLFEGSPALLLFYDASAGTGEFHTVNNGAISLLNSITGWRTSWTHIVRGSFGGSGATDDLLFYDAASGTGEFYTVNNGTISLLRSNAGWRSSWKFIIPGKFVGTGIDSTDLFFYDATSGTGEFYTVSGGQLSLMQSKSDYRVSWTHIVPGIFDSKSLEGGAGRGLIVSSDAGGGGDDN